MKKVDNNINKGVDFIRALFEELNLHGLYQLIPRQKFETLVDKIYTERGFYVEQRANDAVTLQKEVLAKICPFCQSPIFKDEAVVYCNKCRMPYHQNCWQENGCCGIPGCGHKTTVSNIGTQRIDKVIVDVAEENNTVKKEVDMEIIIGYIILTMLMIIGFGVFISSCY